jgi:hypothetical protein
MESMPLYTALLSMVDAASYHGRLHLQLQLQHELTSLFLEASWPGLNLVKPQVDYSVACNTDILKRVAIAPSLLFEV